MLYSSHPFLALLMDIDSLDLATLKALAEIALERFESPRETPFAYKISAPSTVDLKDLESGIENLSIQITDEEEPSASLDGKEIAGIVSQVSDQLEPMSRAFDESVEATKEQFLEDFHAALSTSVRHPALMESINVSGWWDRADDLGVLPQCFGFMMELSTVNTAKDWFSESPSMRSDWVGLAQGWARLTASPKKIEWLDLVLETPSAPRSVQQGWRSVPVNVEKERARFLDEAWVTAQSNALLGFPPHRESEQALAQALRTKAGVQLGLESLHWSRLFLDSQSPEGLAPPKKVQERLESLSALPSDLLDAWLSTPDDSPVNWNQWAGSWSGAYHLSNGVDHAKTSPRRMLWPELARFAQAISKRVPQLNLATDFERAFRAAELHRQLPAVEPEPASKPRF